MPRRKGSKSKSEAASSSLISLCNMCNLPHMKKDKCPRSTPIENVDDSTPHTSRSQTKSKTKSDPRLASKVCIIFIIIYYYYYITSCIKVLKHFNTVNILHFITYSMYWLRPWQLTVKICVTSWTHKWRGREEWCIIYEIKFSIWKDKYKSDENITWGS